MTEKIQTILVADDEPDIADLYKAWLKRKYEVRTAYSGPEAIEELDESVDIVFLDRRMPRMTGDEVISEIRERGLNCLVVLMTAVDPDVDIIGIDFDQYLTKPVMREDIEETIEALEQRPAGSEQVRRYHALVSKKATLEAVKSRTELQRNDDFQQMVDRLETLAAETGNTPPEEDGSVFGRSSDR